MQFLKFLFWSCISIIALALSVVVGLALMAIATVLPWVILGFLVIAVGAISLKEALLPEKKTPPR